MGIAAKNRLENEQRGREHVARLKGFRGTVSAYCRDQGVSRSTMNYWLKKVRTEKSSAAPRLPALGDPGRAVFVPIEVVADPVELRTPSLRTGLPDPRWLAELVLHLSAGGENR